MISIPLKTAAQIFTLYKAVVLPSRLSHDTFLTYHLDYYFGLAMDQRDYALLTEADLQQFTVGSITICPSRVPLYTTQVLTCEASLFFQGPHSYSLCRKSLLLHHQTQHYSITGRSGCFTSRKSGDNTVSPEKWLDLSCGNALG